MDVACPGPVIRVVGRKQKTTTSKMRPSTLKVIVILLFLLASQLHALEDHLSAAGFTILHEAVWLHDSDKIRSLVASGVNVNVAANTGITPLHSAATEGGVREIETLLSLGANLEAKDQYGRTPLFLAVEVNNNPRDIIRCLLRHGADISIVNNAGVTLVDACWTEDAKNIISEKLSETRKPAQQGDAPEPATNANPASRQSSAPAR